MNQDGDLCWFHGKISREFAEQQLNEGSYSMDCKEKNYVCKSITVDDAKTIERDRMDINQWIWICIYLVMCHIRSMVRPNDIYEILMNFFFRFSLLCISFQRGRATARFWFVKVIHRMVTTFSPLSIP